MSSHTRFRLALAGLIILSLLAFILWRSDLSRLWIDPEILEDFVDRVGPWGPLVIVSAQILQVLIAPIPGHALGVAAGYMYGPGWGMLLSTTGLVLGSYLAMWLARVLGRPLVERMTDSERMARIDEYAQRRGLLAFLIIFFLPFMPDDLACFLAGLTPLPLHQLLLIALIARTPGVYATVLLGAYAEDLSWHQFIILSAVSLALGLLFILYGERIERAIFRLLNKLDPP